MPTRRVNRGAARSRWVVTGAVVAVALGAGGVLTSSAAGGGASTFVPITPCRLMDTRPAPDNVGTRATPLAANDTYNATVWGTNGNCTIPTGATAVSMNVVAITPTADSFLTVYPSDAPRPLAANLNWIANQPPTPNAVTATLSADGKISLYNLAGTVNIAADIVGYYQPSGPGAFGTPGPAGPDGAPGPVPVDPANILWVAPSGADFTTVGAALASILPNAGDRYLIKVAPGTYTEPSGIDLKDYVDIEGSGQNVTIITATSSATLNTTVRVAGTKHGEIRNLTITNTGGGAASVALRLTDVVPAGEFRVTDVTAAASGGTQNFGSYVQGSSPILTGLTFTAAGGTNSFAYTNNSSSPSMTDIAATASGGSGKNQAITNQDLTAAPASAPIMVDVRATATGGSAMTAAIYNSESAAPTLIRVTATASGGSFHTVGVYNNPGSSVTVRDSTIVSKDQAALFSDGIFNWDSSATARVINSSVNGSSATVFGGTAICRSSVNGITFAQLSATCS